MSAGDRLYAKGLRADRDAALARAEEAERKVAALTAELHHAREWGCKVVLNAWSEYRQNVSAGDVCAKLRAEGSREATERAITLIRKFEGYTADSIIAAIRAGGQPPTKEQP